MSACAAVGDPNVVASQFQEAVFLNYGENSFHLMKQSMKILEKHEGGFSHRAGKTMPGMLDWFGWCTWDAFYHDVNPQGIKDGLRSLSEGGTPARFLIIVDGWQDVANEFEKEDEPSVEGSSFGGRLVSIKENTKFRQNAKEAINLKDFVTSIKKTFSLKYQIYLQVHFITTIASVGLALSVLSGKMKKSMHHYVFQRNNNNRLLMRL